MFLGALAVGVALFVGIAVADVIGFCYPDFFVLHWLLTPSILTDLPIADQRDVFFFYKGWDGNTSTQHEINFTTAMDPAATESQLFDHFLTEGYSRNSRGILALELPSEATTVTVGIRVDTKPHDGRYSAHVSLVETVSTSESSCNGNLGRAWSLQEVRDFLGHTDVTCGYPALRPPESRVPESRGCRHGPIKSPTIGRQIDGRPCGDG